MLDWVAGVLTSTKTATDITKVLVDMKTDGAVNAKAVELTSVLLQLQQQLMVAQMEQMNMLGRMQELEAKLKEAERQQLDAEQYQLHQFATGAIAYVKRERSTVEPLSHLCSNCFEQGQKVTLQVAPGTQVVQGMKCPRCETAITTKAPGWMCAPVQ